MAAIIWRNISLLLFSKKDEKTSVYQDTENLVNIMGIGNRKSANGERLLFGCVELAAFIKKGVRLFFSNYCLGQ
jgi:hypothetical protein